MLSPVNVRIEKITICQVVIGNVNLHIKILCLIE